MPCRRALRVLSTAVPLLLVALLHPGCGGGGSSSSTTGDDAQLDAQLAAPDGAGAIDGTSIGPDGAATEDDATPSDDDTLPSDEVSESDASGSDDDAATQVAPDAATGSPDAGPDDDSTSDPDATVGESDVEESDVDPPECSADEDCDAPSCQVGLCEDGECVVVDKMCDDAIDCTDDWCDPATDACVHEETAACAACTSADDCSALPLTACEEAVCESGKCVTSTMADGAECSDDGFAADACIVGGTCVAGACSPVQADCAGDSPCLEYGCEPDVGCTTVAVTDGAPCSTDLIAADACADGGSCLDGACEAIAVVCDDENPCTTDVCAPGSGCATVPVDDGLACSTPGLDATPCLDGASCTAGLCVGKPMLCSGPDVCSTYACDPATDSCEASPIPGCDAPCADVSECTELQPGPCQVKVCEGGDCGLANQPDGTVCETDEINANACQIGGECFAGACEPVPVSCADDGDACTQTTCDPEAGCLVADIPGCCNEDEDCDGVLPTTACQSAACVDHACTVETWSDGTECSTEEIEDDACASSGACLAGACEPEMILCNDGNPCTIDGCDPATGCTAVAGADGSGCSTPEIAADICAAGGSCSAGSCVATPTVCNDGNPCTDDSCDPTDGCVAPATSDGTSCSTGAIAADACAIGGLCEAGKCQAIPMDCDDGDACTTDSCDPAAGACSNAPISNCGAVCDNDDYCVEQLGDQGPCAEARCTDQECTVVGLADGLDCTTDEIAGDICATGGTCDNGTCVAVAQDCDPGVACLVGSCDPTDGLCVLEIADACSCDSHEDCFGDEFCKLTDGVGLCVQKLGSGAACADVAEACQSGHCDAPSGGDSVCVQCMADEDCEAATCVEGLCLAQGECVTLEDCGAGDFCVSQGAVIGVCTPPGTVGEGCDDEAGCVAGTLCADGACTECVDDGDCVDGVCVASECEPTEATECASHGDCAPGEYCRTKIVTGDQHCAPTLQPGSSCSSDAACSGGACEDGLCATCDEHDDCPGDALCVDGDCAVVEDTFGGCVSAEDCDLGQTCQLNKGEANTCVPLSGFGEPCLANSGCSTGLCFTFSDPGICLECAGDAQCVGDEACLDSKCSLGEASCVFNADCPAGGWCDGDTCRALRPIGYSCEASSECQVGVCAGPASAKVCQACAEDADCPAGGLCDAENNCVLVGDASECAVDGDCPGNQWCALDPSASNTCVDPSGLGETCSKGAHCESGHCAGSTGAKVCVECKKDAHCEVGAACEDNTCEQKSCGFFPGSGDIDCGDDHYCDFIPGDDNECKPKQPAASSCQTGAQCATGSCKGQPNGICSDCSTSADCPTGETCQDSLCAPGVPCTGNDDCGDKEYCHHAIGSLCDAKVGLGKECKKDSACKSGHCAGESGAKVCVKCEVNADCGAEEYCDGAFECQPDKANGEVCSGNGKCLSNVCDNDGSGLCVDCVLDGSCAPDELCVENSCIPADGLPLGEACTSNGQCATEKCTTGQEVSVCVQCKGNATCPEGTYCNKTTDVFVCAPQLGFGDTCVADGNCASQMCLDGVCIDCASTADCADDEYCATNAGSACLPVGDVGDDCGKNAACASGSCVDLGSGKVCVECEADGDCEDGGSCQGGACVITGLPGAPCVENADCAYGACSGAGLCNEACGATGDTGLCPDDEVCVFDLYKHCAPLGDKLDACLFDYQCKSGVCDQAAGMCVACVTHADCGAKWCKATSNGNACVTKKPTGELCAGDGDCQSGLCLPDLVDPVSYCSECTGQDDCDDDEFCEVFAGPNDTHVCSPAVPLGQPCGSNLVCGGLNCVDGKCSDYAQPCQDDDDCSGYCDPGAHTCSECSKHGDCPSDQWCKETNFNTGYCTDDLAPLAACQSNAQCPSGACEVIAGTSKVCAQCSDSLPCANDATYCSGIYCTSKGDIHDTCSDSAPCLAGLTCFQSATISFCYECLGDGECGTNETCNSSECVAKVGDGKPCGEDDDCVSDICVKYVPSSPTGFCRECKAHSDCGGNTYCHPSKYTCEDEKELGVPCSSDAECLSSDCDLGLQYEFKIPVCVECDSDSDCPEFDYCETSGVNECKDKGTTSMPCSSGNECLSGTCLSVGFCY